MQRLLSFEQTPPLSIPLRFFLTAPVFSSIAGLIVMWFGPAAFQSRWSAVTLAITHLLTLGFLSMCMVGALLQILPVVAGIEVPGDSRTARTVHVLLTSGVFLLAAAFLTSYPVLFRIAVPVLVGAFGWLLIALTRRVWKVKANAMLGAIRLALAALGVTAALGATLAAGFGWQLSLPLLTLTDIHASWGLLGWLMLLVTGVAYQVVPMFQVTPIYPQWMARYFAGTCIALLVLWSGSAILAPGSIWFIVLSAALAACGVALSVVTFYLLWKRKRPKPDPTTHFWRAALGSLFACALVWAAGTLFPALAAEPAYPLVLGVLAIAGFGYSVINGMLYKIVPFLVWYHLQNSPDAGCTRAPSVKQILGDAVAERQFRLHLAGLLLLIGAAVVPQWLAHVAGLAFTLSAMVLWWNLVKAARMYRDKAAEMSAAAAAAAAAKVSAPQKP